jgi:hypothetical protein
MIDSMKKRELLRLSVIWPLMIKTEKGNVLGETRNITGEGFFLYCSERLREGTVYPVTIKLPERQVAMKGKVTWSNLDNCTSLNLGPAMGFYFMRIDDEKDKQILREAIVNQGNYPPHLRQEHERPADSFPSREAAATAPAEGTPRTSQPSRN